MSKNNLEIITLKKENITDFAKERNILMNKSKAGWIFFLDSDEKLSPELKKELDNFNPTWRVGQPQNVAYFVKRYNYFLGKYIGTDRIIRLMSKGSGRWERKVHEVFHLQGGKVGELKNPIIHNSYENLHETIEKIDRYSTIHASENKHEGKTSNLFKIVIYPKFKFVQSLFMGRGVVFSIMQSFHSYLSWSKQYLNEKNS